MILVTGTTGSGKTTTLAAMIDYINQNVRRHIVTVEDPIEILHSDNEVDDQSARGRHRYHAVTPPRSSMC